MNFRSPRSSGGEASRFQGFTDAVIAIIMTLLVLELRLPHLPSDPTTAEVIQALGDIAPKLIAFTVSFFWVAIVWVNHHHVAATVERTNSIFLWLNIIMLFFLALVPFTTGMIGDNPDVPLIVSLYAINDALVAVAWTALVYYTLVRGKLARPTISAKVARKELLRGVSAIALYVVAAVVAMVFTQGALVLYAVIPFLYVAPALMGIDLSADPIDED